MRPERRSRGHFGLRERLIAALLLTSVVTVVAAAIALLSPLETRLEHDRFEALSAAATGARPSFARLPRSALRAHNQDLLQAARALRRRTGAEVDVFNARGRLLAATDPDAPPLATDIPGILHRERSTRRLVYGGDSTKAQVAIYAEVHDRPIVVVLTESLEKEQAAVRIVGHAFLTAALIGLAAALLLGIGLASGLVRRLESLRRATIKVTELGPDAELAADRRRDEVGDLTRSFATMQERLRDQEQARRTFVSTASHELRTPLASLGLMLDMLEDDLALDDPDLPSARAHVDRARHQIDRLAKLAHELLDLSRIDAGVPLRRELVDLREICRAVIAEFDPGADNSVYLDAASPGWAIADPGSVARIARILVDNALRFTPAGGHVHVAVACDGAHAKLSVSDEGPGVPAAERELIFERFRRGSEVGEGAGFGLGLAIGRELARRMEGNLRLADTAAGARFELTLPSAPDVRTGEGEGDTVDSPAGA